MFVRFTRASGDEVIVNATLVISADEIQGGVTLKMSNDDKIPVQGSLKDTLSKLNDVRLS